MKAKIKETGEIVEVENLYDDGTALQDIIDLLPSTIEGCELEIHKVSVCYFDYESARLFVYKVNQFLIDAAYELLVWAIENKFVETNKNE